MGLGDDPVDQLDNRRVCDGGHRGGGLRGCFRPELADLLVVGGHDAVVDVEAVLDVRSVRTVNLHPRNGKSGDRSTGANV